MLRAALFALALLGTSVAHAQPAPPPSKLKTWTDKQGLHIEQLSPGAVYLCPTAASVEITVRGGKMTVKGARVCQPGDGAPMIIDQCNIVGGTITAPLSMNCSSRD